MIPIRALTKDCLFGLEHTESPIEVLMLRAFMRSKFFTITKPSDTPLGEGFFVIPQYCVGNYRADFLILARGYRNNTRIWPPNSEIRVAIECDGHEHHKDRKEYDNKRDEYLKSQGIDTLRFSGSTIYNYGDQCADNIQSYVHDKIRGVL